MICFSQQDLQIVERQWRSLSSDHEWVGWAAVGGAPAEVWLFRKRSNWRYLPLRRDDQGYVLSDEHNKNSIRFRSLEAVADALAQIPPLSTAA
jgi:hypothetical protein